MTTQRIYVEQTVSEPLAAGLQQPPSRPSTPRLRETRARAADGLGAEPPVLRLGVGGFLCLLLSRDHAHARVTQALFSILILPTRTTPGTRVSRPFADTDTDFLCRRDERVAGDLGLSAPERTVTHAESASLYAVPRLSFGQPSRRYWAASRTLPIRRILGTRPYSITTRREKWRAWSLRERRSIPKEEPAPEIGPSNLFGAARFTAARRLLRSFGSRKRQGLSTVFRAR